MAFLETNQSHKLLCFLAGFGGITIGLGGCQTPESYRTQADQVAYDILDETWQAALGHTEDGFTIQPASETLRRRLLLDQHLPISDLGSLNSSDAELIEQWPDSGYFGSSASGQSNHQPPLVLSLDQALEIAVTNSRSYQSEKEAVFQTALRLDLERNNFRNTWSGVVNTLLSTNLGTSTETTGVVQNDSLSVSKRFKNGSAFMGLLAVDLANLLNGSRESSTGVRIDTSLSIPLLRGSGQFIVTEPLTQAQRDVVYAIYGFERFKRSFAVSTASEYLAVLQQLDRVDNAVENYRRVVASTRRARRLADAGRLPKIQVDQSLQDELRARNSWISAVQSAEQSLDRFKLTLGIPPDATIELDSSAFETLLNSDRYAKYLMPQEQEELDKVPPADAPVSLERPSMDDAGPVELDEGDAILIALTNRLDLRVAVGRIVDAQRGVAIAADNLRADITLLGSASIGESRSLGSASLDNGQLRTDRGFYSLLLGIDLPFERTRERNGYRNSLISYEQTVRALQTLEDNIKFNIRSSLRTLLESRESIKIQAESVRVAQRRVDSTNLFLQAGRAEIRDLLEAQNSLNAAQDSLTNAVVSYRISELELQRDLGVLEVTPKGLWIEFDPDTLDLDSIRAMLEAFRPANTASDQTHNDRSNEDS